MALTGRNLDATLPVIESKLAADEKKMEWEKTKTSYNRGVDSFIVYKNTKPTYKNISHIAITTKIDGSIRFDIWSEEVVNASISNLRTEIANLGLSVGSYLTFITIFFFITDLTETQSKKIVEALKLIQAVEPLDKGMECDICRLLHIETPELIRDEAFKLIKHNNLESAVRLAVEQQKKENYGLIAEIIEFLFSQISVPDQIPQATLEEIYSICGMVIEANPFYPDAQSKLAHLLLLQDDNSDSLDSEHSDLEKSERIFLHALRSKDQHLVTGMLSQLCDFPIGSFKEVKCDAEDIILKLTTQVRDLSKELQKKLEYKNNVPPVTASSTESVYGIQGLFGNTSINVLPSVVQSSLEEVSIKKRKLGHSD